MGSFIGPLLIVDDEVAVRDVLTELVSKDGREIVTASNGQEALDRLKMTALANGTYYDSTTGCPR